MAGFNIESPPSTRDPAKISNYLVQMDESIRFVLQNIDEDNLGEDLYNKLNNISTRLSDIEKALGIEKE